MLRNFLYIGGLRPNTVILGFYDDNVPEDKLRTHPFYKRRWLRSTKYASSIQRQQSFPPESSTIAFESINSVSSTTTNDLHSILNFPGRNIHHFL